MVDEYLQSPGEEISVTDLRIPKAQEIVATIPKLSPYYTLREMRRISDKDDSEVVVFDTEVEVGQRTFYDIRNTERIAVIFPQADDKFPEVLALRESFPKVPHINLREQEKPRSLCLFAEKYEELKLRWTPVLFLERVREWLSLTAKGELHAADQPLEPLLMTSQMHLIIPFDLLTKGEENLDLLIIRRAEYGENRITFIADRIEKVPPQNGEVPYAATVIKCNPQPHGVIDSQPTTLYELHNFLLKAGVDLLSLLKKRLPGFKNNEKYKLMKARLVLIIDMPKIRREGESPESNDTWAFLILNTIEEIGIEVGIWAKSGGTLASLEFAPDPNKKGESIKVYLLNPVNSLSRELAAQLNDCMPEKRETLLIGGGALGSQVLMNLVRMGFGKWTIVDEDCLLPHNLARHALVSDFLGHSKAETLAYHANKIIDGEEVASYIVADVLNPLSASDALKSAFNKSHFIIDASTSIPASRYISQDINSSARRISIFLSPSGKDSVLLAEDAERGIPLDCVEAQYYRYLINESSLGNHLKRSDGPIRYARSCRDLSFVIPQDLVALHSAICARGIRNISSDLKASISIWEANTKDFSVKFRSTPVYEVSESKFGDWTLYCDSWLLAKISQSRKERLPNETGGVLIGSFDMQRKIVYVVDTILSPPDSQEWPMVYIRGCQGLKNKVERIKETTAGMLDYVGEWHSHPGSGTTPSQDDIKAFSWLFEIMDVCGQPALMMIAAELKHAWYLGQMKSFEE